MQPKGAECAKYDVEQEQGDESAHDGKFRAYVAPAIVVEVVGVGHSEGETVVADLHFLLCFFRLYLCDEGGGIGFGVQADEHLRVGAGQSSARDEDDVAVAFVGTEAVIFDNGGYSVAGSYFPTLGQGRVAVVILHEAAAYGLVGAEEGKSHRAGDDGTVGGTVVTEDIGGRTALNGCDAEGFEELLMQ